MMIAAMMTEIIAVDAMTSVVTIMTGAATAAAPQSTNVSVTLRVIPTATTARK